MHGSDPAFPVRRQDSESASQIITRLEGHQDATPRSLHKNRSLLQSPEKTTRTSFMENYKNMKDKESPLRRSIQNFMSVIKKSPAAFKKKPIDDSDATPAPVFESLCSPDRHSAPSSQPRGPRPRAAPLEDIPTGHVALHAGPLLYLCHTENESRDIFPVWTSCSVSLEGSALLATWYTAMGNPFTQIIDITRCTDVCALTMEQLDPALRDMLPRSEDGSDPRIFEITFNDRPSQCFGASTVKERARWINAIWDAVIPSREPRRTRSIYASDTVRSIHSNDTGGSTQSDRAKPPLARPITTRSDRSLPPVPMESPALPEPQGMRTPSETPRRLLSRPLSDSPTKSSSIANLSQKSMVKQRLAQIQSPRSSSRSLPSLPGSPVSRRSLSRIPSRDSPVLSRNSASLCDQEPPPGMSSASRSRSRPRSQFSVLDCYGEDADRYSMQAAGGVGENAMNAPPTDDKMQPVMDTVLNQAAKHQERITTLESRIMALQSDVRALPSKLNSSSATSTRGSGSKGALPELGTVQRAVLALETRAQGTSETLASIERKLDDLVANKNSYQRTSSSGIVRQLSIAADSSPMNNHLAGIDDKVDRLQLQIQQDVPEILHRLNKLTSKSSGEGDSVATMRDVDRGRFESRTKVELTAIHAKLDDMLARSQPGDSAQLSQIVSLLRVDSEKRDGQARCDADTVRYLSDLNTWLSSFVNSGSLQIQTMSAEVAKLSAQLVGDPAQPQGPLVEMRQLAAEMRARDQDLSALHEAVGRLVGDLHAQGGGAMAQILEGQRQNQEVLVRGLASQISKEIRDERLRFVDAMQEATSLNVTAQVEDFKRQMTREVRAMIQDVGQLRNEQQAVAQGWQSSNHFDAYDGQHRHPRDLHLPMAVNTVNRPNRAGKPLGRR
ncbi:hypothetical protein BD626DRAFT_13674 [Schizophyllum amplum]|uniref:PH domain-containing protein n=1 Tax=Schizophyllum amplum TaxID=97359 RepID=A0A550CXJ5_9AGAR|nr:hypothetical protein BD626DRAFT_13674 [Auriculariopsis ampla]